MQNYARMLHPGLLDAGGLIADIVNILDRINGILDLVNNL